MKTSWKRELWEWAKAIIVGLLLFIVIRSFLFSNYVVDGQSMMPTLEDEDKLIVNRIGYTLGNIDRFDVIVFHATEEDDYVKRVIGLPGDTVSYQNDQLFVNGEPLPEPYLDEFKAASDDLYLTGDFTLEQLPGGESQVPEDMYFVLGDNRRGSKDSRHIGFIPKENVVGEVSVRYWPFDNFEAGFNPTK